LTYIINGWWWSVGHDPGSPGDDSDEIWIADYGHETCDFVTRVETRKIADASIESYRLKVSMVNKNDTDYVEREIAKYILLGEKNELLEFQRLDK
jgi:hypothetical protein